jgi:alpha-ketoglutarate-dependent taurine dioxygenase
LLTRRGDAWAVYYVPWLVEPPEDEGTRRLLERFTDYVHDKEAHDLIAVRLRRGESLFVDNRRILHGRGALPEGSRRHLVRLYLQTDDAG